MPGDTAAAVAARRRLHDLGVTAPLLEEIAAMLAACQEDVVLDAGCGEGFYLGNLARRFGFTGQGMDISTKAIAAAAARYPECEWIVGNADRFVPYAHGTFSIVMSITARMNAPEFRRVLRSDGRLLVALASPEDLIELRGVGTDRIERTIQTFATHFKLVTKSRVTTCADLDASAVDDVLHSIYRPMTTMPSQPMRVTFSLDLLVFEPA